MKPPRFCVIMLGGLAALSRLPSEAGAQTPGFTTVHLRIGGKEALFKTSPLSDGKVIYVPLEILKKIGVRGKIQPSGNTVSISPPTRAERVELDLVTISGKRMVSLEDLAHALEAAVEPFGEARPPEPQAALDQPTGPSKNPKTFSLLAKVVEAGFSDGSLHVLTSFPVPYRVRNLAEVSPQRGFLDCLGAVVDASVRVGFTPPADHSVLRIRTGQNSPEVARVVLEVESGYGLKPAESVSNSSVQILSGVISGLALTKKQTGLHSSSPAQTAEGRPNEGKPPIKRGDKPSRAGTFRRVLPVAIHSLKFETEGDGRVKLFLATEGKIAPHPHYENDGTQLVVDLPNSYLKLTDPDNARLSLSHPLVQSVRAEQGEVTAGGTSSARLVVELGRVAGFGVSAGSRGLTLDLRVPKNAGGSMAGKLIVIDPGHGGSSSGALGGGYQEKNLTLAISLRLRALLESCGARVVMTRDSDVDVDLYARPRMSNELHADLFISIHNDSFTANVRGTTTYYHKGDASARAMAFAVQREIAAVSGIPSKGALSDGVLYENGLAVLRMSQMPAILVEVAYISNSSDRARLADPDFQQRVASAITRGVRAYVEGNPFGREEASAPAEEAAPMERVEESE